MSVKYTPVQWNPFKYKYNLALVAMVAVYLYIFVELSPDFLGYQPTINGQVHNARAFGSCAFFMLTVILAIGPLARLDKRFLPLLYNRRHFGVLTLFVAITHAMFILSWYFAFSQSNTKRCCSRIFRMIRSLGFRSRYLAFSRCSVWVC